MRLSRPVAAITAATLLASASALSPLSAYAAPHKKEAATTPAAAAPASGDTKPANPIVASVNGDPIHLDRVRATAQTLPDEMRGMPPQMLFPMIVNQLVDQKALLIEAQKEGLQKDPEVQKTMQAAADQALQNVYLSRAVEPQITDDAIQAAYAKDYAGKTGEKEVHARHILVADEKTANDIIKQLKAGGDFAALAKKDSTDKGSAAADGDLGWFKKGDMLPDFSAAAFAMTKGQVSDKPVHTPYGWHVIQVLDTRTSTAPAFATVHDHIRQKLIQQDVRAVVEKAVAQVKVVRYNPDGTPVTDKPAPPAAAAAAGASPVPAQAAAPATPGATPPSGE